MRPFTTGPAVVAASVFSWKAGHGVAELSELPSLPHFQVWPDSCDLGFAVQGKHGATVVFVQNGSDRDADGDVTAFHYVAVNPTTGRPDTNKSALRITLFND